MRDRERDDFGILFFPFWNFVFVVVVLFFFLFVLSLRSLLVFVHTFSFCPVFFFLFHFAFLFIYFLIFYYYFISYLLPVRGRESLGCWSLRRNFQCVFLLRHFHVTITTSFFFFLLLFLFYFVSFSFWTFKNATKYIYYYYTDIMCICPNRSKYGNFRVLVNIKMLPYSTHKDSFFMGRRKNYLVIGNVLFGVCQIFFRYLYFK